jgi:hypothetical protein
MRPSQRAYPFRKADGSSNDTTLMSADGTAHLKEADESNHYSPYKQKDEDWLWQPDGTLIPNTPAGDISASAAKAEMTSDASDLAAAQANVSSTDRDASGGALIPAVSSDSQDSQAMDNYVDVSMEYANVDPNAVCPADTSLMIIVNDQPVPVSVTQFGPFALDIAKTAIQRITSKAPSDSQDHIIKDTVAALVARYNLHSSLFRAMVSCTQNHYAQGSVPFPADKVVMGLQALYVTIVMLIVSQYVLSYNKGSPVQPDQNSVQALLLSLTPAAPLVAPAASS